MLLMKICLYGVSGKRPYCGSLVSAYNVIEERNRSTKYLIH